MLFLLSCCSCGTPPAPSSRAQSESANADLASRDRLVDIETKIFAADHAKLVVKGGSTGGCGRRTSERVVKRTNMECFREEFVGWNFVGCFYICSPHGHSKQKLHRIIESQNLHFLTCTTNRYTILLLQISNSVSFRHTQNVQNEQHYHKNFRISFVKKRYLFITGNC